VRPIAGRYQMDAAPTDLETSEEPEQAARSVVPAYSPKNGFQFDR
jgi:hypothetical protein